MTGLIIGLVVIVIFAVAGAVVGLLFGGSSFPFGGIGFFLGAFVGVCPAIVPITWGQTHYNERTLTCTIEDKDRGGNEGGMRIYTKECGTLQNTDSVWRGKWDSADIYAQLDIGKTYELTVAGWRLGFTSDFPNIFTVKEVEQ